VEQATLRPVPLRPAGPVDPAEALAHVAFALPELDEAAARALALVEIAGRTREQAGEETGVASEVLADALYRARKALRRSIFPLSASGWCERAERLLSDRIDAVLVPPAPARLDVHLRNCERCVDHERRLSQAREKLVREFIEAHPESAAAGPAERARVAELRVVEANVIEEPEPDVWTGPTRIVPGFAGPVVEAAVGESEPLSHIGFAGPGGQAEYSFAHAETSEPSEPEDPTIEEEIAPAEPGDATPSEHDAETFDPLVPPDEEAAPVVHPDEPNVLAPTTGARFFWNALIVVSVGLAVCALILVLLAVAGVERVL
jgi:predicted DNA-binding protein (UPF0251 family)